LDEVFNVGNDKQTIRPTAARRPHQQAELLYAVSYSQILAPEGLFG